MEYKREFFKKLFNILISLMMFSNILIGNFPLSHSNNANASSIWIQESKEDFQNGNSNKLTIKYIDGITELRLNITKLNKWTEKSTSTKPSARTFSAMASASGTDDFILFGGDDGSERLNDTWIFNLTTNNWIKKEFSIKPQSREHHALASIYGTDKILLFGGASSYNDTWIYDLDEECWILKEPAISPSTRYSHGMAPIFGTQKVLLYGGTHFGLIDDTWIFDLNKNKWSQKNPIGANPGRRDRFGMASIWGTDKVLLFGGSHQGYFSDETWIYDNNDNKWYNMTSSIKPSKRTSSTMATIHETDKIILFGGYDGSFNSDTWIYDYSENLWTKMSASSNPDPRTGHTLASNSKLSSIVLFGGGTLSNDFDDTWVYKPYSYFPEGTFTSEAYDTGSESSFKTLQWSSIESNFLDIKFQIRTAPMQEGLQLNEFVGPDGSTSKYYNDPPSNIWSGHDGDSWIQYKAYLSTINDEMTPILKNVSISYNNLPKAILKNPKNNTIITTNNRTFQWSFSDRDSAAQSAFQVIIDDSQSFNSIDYDSGKIYTSNQFWNFPSGTEYTKLPNGNWFWKVRIMDNDDDWGIYSEPWNVTINTKPPTSQIIMPQNNRSYNDMDNIYGIAVNPNYDSELNKIEISIYNLNEEKYWNGLSWIGDETWILTSGTSTWSYNSSNIYWTSSHHYLIQSRAHDNALNIESQNPSHIFIYDSDRPSSDIINLKDNYWVNNMKSITGIAKDMGGAGLDIIQILITDINDNTYWRGSSWGQGEYWLNVYETNNWSFNSTNVDWVNGRQYAIQSRAIDKASNLEIDTNKYRMKFDNQPPENLSIVINNNFKYTNSLDVVLSLNADDRLSGIKEMTFSTNGLNWTSWENYSNSKVFKLTKGDGEKSIYFIAQDKAGNIANTAFDSITLDTFDPHSLSIIINDGATETSSKSVNLKLSAQDDLSGVYQMSFSNDRRTWTPWDNFSVTKRFDLPSGDGEKTIYFKVKDWAGNEAKPVEASIKLQSPSFVESNLLGILSIIIILIIVILIIIALVLKKRKQKSLSEKSVTIKPDIQPQQTGIPAQFQQPQLYPQQQTSQIQPVLQQPQPSQVPMPMPYQYPQLPPGQQQPIYPQQDRKELK